MKKAIFYRKPSDIESLRKYTDQELDEMLIHCVPDISKKQLKQLKKLINTYHPTPYKVEKVITLTAKEYDNFANNLLYDCEIIKENKSSCFEDADGVIHCIAITSPEREWELLVDCEGYDYARYVAKVRRVQK